MTVMKNQRGVIALNLDLPPPPSSPPRCTPSLSRGPPDTSSIWVCTQSTTSAGSGQAMQHLIPCWILVTDSLLIYFYFFHLQMKANTWREKSEYLSLWRKSKKYAKSTWISNQRWHVLIDGESEPRDETGIETVSTSFYDCQMKKNSEWLIASPNVWKLLIGIFHTKKWLIFCGIFQCQIYSQCDN